MKLKEESFTIVIVGNWNRYILSPAWSAKEIFNEPGLQVEIGLDFGLPPRYTSSQSNIRMIPTNDNVTFIALKQDDETLKKMEDIAYRLVDKLSYTPIKAFGINFGFVEDANQNDLLAIFNFADNELLNKFGCQATSNSIVRRLIVENRTLNLNISNKGNEVFFDLNFHYDVAGTSEIMSKVKNSVIKNKSFAENLLKSIYKIDYNKVEG